MPEESSLDRDGLIAALGAALREVSGLGVLYSHAVAARLGLAPTDLECLGYLTDGPITAGALAEATRLTTGAITGVVDRLERAGFAARQSDPSDRRRVLVRLTPAAADRLGPLYAPMERAALSALEGYSAAELSLLLGFLQRSRDAALAAMAELRADPPRSPADID
jgi:DNA-binding MarR family transcriptional regulator